MEKEVDKQMKIKFLMFENEKNVCWLDASIALVAHNRTFKKIVENLPESQINKIISAYDEATNAFNDSESEQKTLKTQKILLAIQSSTLKYLKQFLKFIPGEPDSAFCALLNLIYQDKSKIKEYLNVSWIWRKQCANCGVNSKSATCLKPIITLSKVDTFHPECPSSIYVCACKTEQEMKLIYKELPPSLIFHFEKGIGTGTNLPLNFSIKGREYELTGIVVLEKSSDPNLNHFVTWIRNPVFNMWLECNDLNAGFATFNSTKPKYDLKDVYIAVFEAFDNLDKILNDDDELSIDQEQDVENSNVELINLSDEEGVGENVDSGGKPSNINNKNFPVCDLKFTSEVPLDEPKIETKSKDLDSQCKVIDEFIESKEFKAETTDCKDNKIEDSTVNKNETFCTLFANIKTSTSDNLEIHNKEKTKDNEEECIRSSLSLPNGISFVKHESKAESDNVNCQNKTFDDFHTAEATDKLKHKVTDVLGENKKEKNSSQLNSANVGENITADNTSYKEPFSGEKSFQNISIPNEILEGKANARENEVNEYDENKLHLKMKHISLKENTCITPNEEKIGKVEDRSIASLSKRKKEGSQNISSDKEKNVVINARENEVNEYDENKLHLKMKQISLEENTCITPNEEKIGKVEDRPIASLSKGKKEGSQNINSDKEKNVVIMNDQCAGTSLDHNNISENIPQCSASVSRSKDFDCQKKKSKVSDSKNVKKIGKTNGKVKQSVNPKMVEYKPKPLNEESRAELRRLIDVNVSNTYAAFFDSMIKEREKRMPH